jgi:hypothetical protein
MNIGYTAGNTALQQSALLSVSVRVGVTSGTIDTGCDLDEACAQLAFIRGGQGTMHGVLCHDCRRIRERPSGAVVSQTRKRIGSSNASLCCAVLRFATRLYLVKARPALTARRSIKFVMTRSVDPRYLSSTMSHGFWTNRQNPQVARGLVTGRDSRLVQEASTPPWAS